MAELLAMLRKEWKSEGRTIHGLLSAGLFSLLAVVTLSYSTYLEKPSPTVAGGLIGVALLFSAVSGLPRTLLAEEEQGTFDLLRMIAPPQAAIWGKMLFNIFQMLITALLLGVVFVAFGGIEVKSPGLYVATLAVEALALGAGVTFCGALSMGASNRWVLVGVLALPILLPQMAAGIGAFRGAFGAGSTQSGWTNLLVLFGYATGLLSIGPVLVASIWKPHDTR